MKKWTEIDSRLTPDGAKLALFERDGSYTVRLNGVDLMSTRETASEEALARLGCAHLYGPDTRVLIGGLGMGFTLKAALETAPQAYFEVAELMEAMVTWNSDPLLPLAAEALKNPRVQLHLGDVIDVIKDADQAFDSILLDVDNGPAALSAPGNRWLYKPSGLSRIHQALRPGGCLAVWSIDEAPEFEKRLRRADFQVETHSVRGSGGGRRTIFLGRVA